MKNNLSSNFVNLSHEYLAPKVCPNQSSHISAFPGWGRKPCPNCGSKYVKDGKQHDAN
jgi:hypothetical protein